MDAKQSLEHYKKTGELKLPDDGEIHWEYYQALFMPDYPEAWRELCLEQNKEIALLTRKKLEKVDQASQDVILQMTAELARAHIDRFFEPEILDLKLVTQVAEIWITTFKKYPAFKNYLFDAWQKSQKNLPFPVAKFL